MWWFLMACGVEEDENTDTADFCATQPVVTYANFGEGFLKEHCQACHASTAVERNGAPDEVIFDDFEGYLGWQDRVMARVVEEQTMPPSGGVSEDDRTRAEIWLTCYRDQ